MHVCILHLQLDINTVAAGGGSRLFFRAGMFVVGPESAGANPGPTCYCKGICAYTHTQHMRTYTNTPVLRANMYV